MSKTLIPCFIFTALPCEAKPLIARFKLKKLNKPHPFAIYSNDEIVLTISGIGKVAMAAAVAYSLAIFEYGQNPVLVNIGVAGHQNAELGSLFVAHKIIDTDSDKCFYPSLANQTACETKALQTESQPQTNYKDDTLHDMEASAFYEIASRFSTSEFIQCFKVISDNQDTSIEAISAILVTEWIAEHIAIFEQEIQRLLSLKMNLELLESRYFQTLTEQWHFTVAGKIKLTALLQRWQVLTNNADLDFTQTKIAHAKACLFFLEQQIESLQFKL